MTNGFTPIPKEQEAEIHKIVSSCMRIINGLRELHKEVDGKCSECRSEYPCQTWKVAIDNG